MVPTFISANRLQSISVQKVVAMIFFIIIIPRFNSGYWFVQFSLKNYLSNNVKEFFVAVFVVDGADSVFRVWGILKKAGFSSSGRN